MSTTSVPFRAFSLETFISTIHRGQVALWSWDPVLEIAYLDELAMDFWGVETDSISMKDLWARVNPEQRDATIQAWRNSANAEGPYEFIFQIDRPKADPVWIAARGVGNTVGRAGGEVLAIFVDVTDDVNASVTQQTLLREMGHRISNLFAVTNGILRLTKSKHVNVTDFAEDLSQRFAQLSHAYKATMRTPSTALGQITVAEAITSLLAPYGVSSAQIRFNLDDGPRVDDQALTSLALILHELITNAMKYGALATQDGTLAVTFAPAEQGYILRWAEKSTKMSVSEDQVIAGFGERLIRQTAQMAFGAEIRRSFPADGLVLEMPIAADRLTF